MFGKKKKDNEFYINEELIEDNSIVENEDMEEDFDEENLNQVVAASNEPMIVNNDAVQIDDQELALEKPAKKSKTKSFMMYKFIIKVIATVLLLTFGVLVLVFQQQALVGIFMITGGVAVLQALIRSTLLLKKDRTKRAKLTSLIELLVELAIGGLFVMFAFGQVHFATYGQYDGLVGQPGTPDNVNQTLLDFAKFGNANYALFAGLLFLVGVASYMLRVMLFEEKNDKVKFSVYFVCLFVASFLFVFYANKNWSIDGLSLAITIASLSLVSAILIGTEASVGFYKHYVETHPDYKEKKAAKKAAKKAQKNEETVDYSEIDTNIISESQTENNNNDFVN